MEFHLVQACIVFCIGLGASLLSGFVGAGAGLITVPLLIFVGMEPTVAVATTTFGTVGLSMGALSGFRGATRLRLMYVKPFTYIAVAAGLAGPFLLLSVRGESLERLVATFMSLAVLLFLFKKHIGAEARNVSRLQRTMGYALYAILLTLQAAFGSGIGVAIVFVLVLCFGLTLTETNMTLRLPQLIAAVISIGLFAYNGVLDYTYGVVLLVAMFLGGFVGSHMAIQSGDRVVKWVFVSLVFILAVTLVM